MFGSLGDQAIDQSDDVFRVDKRHFQIELRELGLAVGSQVFVAETLGDLDVAVKTGDHQDLFVKLRRLRQRVEVARMHAAGDQVIASSFGCAAAEDGRFDVDEIVLGEVVSHALDDFAATDQGLLHFFAAKVQEAILQTQIFAGQIGLAGREGRRFGGRKDLEVFAANFDFTGFQFRVGFAFQSIGHHAADQDHAFVGHVAGLFDQRFVGFGWPDDDLGQSVTIPQIDENGSAMVSFAVHPSAQGHGGADVRFAKRAAGVGS